MVRVDAKYLRHTATLCGEVKETSYAMAGIREDRRLSLLDVGCGIGMDTVAIAQRVAPGSRIVGIDVDPAMVADADGRARALGAEVEHRCQDAARMDFTGEFDVVRAERVFQHLPNPQEVFAAMVRAAVPGGRIVVVDTDWMTLQCSAFDDAENELVARAYAEVLTFGASLDDFARLFGRHDLREVQAETIRIRLDHDDYTKGSKFGDLVRHVLERPVAERLSGKLHAAARHDHFAVLDVVLITGLVPAP